MFHRCVGALVGLAMMGMAGSANAALIVDGSGNLLGATDILVDGTLYDVTFVDGSCVDLFSGCDDALADFDFTDNATALLAAQALLDQVFIDGVDGLFDTDPELTFGCENLTLCEPIIPFGFSTITTFTLTGANNSSNPLLDNIFSGSTNIANDFSLNSIITYARFTPVPEPSTLLLFGIGLAGLGFMRRRRKHRQPIQVAPVLGRG